MYNKILVPTDVSEHSRHALIAALDLARQFGSEVELFHVTYTPQAYVGYSINYGIYISPEEIAAAGEAALEAALARIDTGNVSIMKKHVSGYPASAILEEVKTGFDLVVMGSHGHGALTGAIIGSVTQKVLAHAECPVLIVK